MEGGELRRSVTLSEQLSVVDSSNLRDLHKVRDEDEIRLSRRRGGDALKPGSSIAGDKREPSAPDRTASGRTLLDIIRDEREVNGMLMSEEASSGVKWKSFRDRLRLRSAAAAWEAASSVQTNPISDPELDVSVRPTPVRSRTMSRSISVRNPNAALPASVSDRGAIVSEYNLPPFNATTVAVPAAPAMPREPSAGGNQGEDAMDGGERSDLGEAGEVSSAPAAASEEQPARVSLMALLEQTDMQWGSGGEGFSAETAEAEEDDEVPEEEEADGSGSGMVYVCCVCMVRHKGAAFIPCGHTFCRLCSRELWVSRGICPLCNGFILEILDIF